MLTRKDISELGAEEVLDLLRQRLMDENTPLYDTDNLMLKNIARNNDQIIGLLIQAEALVRLNGDLLDYGNNRIEYEQHQEQFRQGKGRYISLRPK